MPSLREDAGGLTATLAPCESFPISPDEAQDPDGARGGRAHGPDHPPDAPGFQIRELDPTARRSQAYRLYMRSRRANTGPGHAGHPNMDLSLRMLLVCCQSAPSRVGAARHRRAAEHPQPPGGTRRRRQTESSVLATRTPTWRTRKLAARPSRRAARTSRGERRLAVRPPPRSRCARSRRRCVGGNCKFPIRGNRKPHTLVVGGLCPAFHDVGESNSEGAGGKCTDGRRGCC